MSGVERRRLFCAVLFHFAAALCVIWSLCVLIERAAEEVKKNQVNFFLNNNTPPRTGCNLSTVFRVYGEQSVMKQTERF